MNSYELSRSWFDFSFENPDKIKPIHTAIYFFAIEHCNRLGWKKKFGFPTIMAMEAIGMKSYGTYKKHLDEIVSFGFVKVHEYSKNQHSSNVIELTLNDKASTKALDKALSKHGSKQHQGTGESTGSIDKPLTLEPSTLEQEALPPKPTTLEDKIAAANKHVIQYLNTLTGKSFKPDTAATKKLIAARVKDGHGWQAFKTVMDGRFAAWSNDPKMREYLRPETLFGSKFESYLNAEPTVTAKADDNTFVPKLEVYNR